MARRRKLEPLEGSGAATATSTSSEVVGESDSRGELCIVNESAGEVWLGLGVDAVAHRGPYLRPYGGSWWTPAADTIFRGAVNCIQEGGGSLVLTYYEY